MLGPVLHERLRPEHCQTVEIAPAPGVEPELEPLAAFKGEVEPRFGGFTWLQQKSTRGAILPNIFLNDSTPPPVKPLH
jgi:hypothetical protein